MRFAVDGESGATESLRRSAAADAAICGFAYCVLTSLLVYAGAHMGGLLLVPFGGVESARGLVNGNAVQYAEIATTGYEYAEGTASTVAFFPLYPLLARAVTEAAGWSADSSLLVVAQCSTFAAFVLLALYLRERLADAPREAPDYSLLAMGLFPAGVFFRCGYSESTFLALAVLTMLALRRGWPLAACAAIVGLATAARPVGAALLVPLAWHIWLRSASWRARIAQWLVWLPVGCWGLFAYMAYLYAAFGDPLAFVEAQGNWRMRPEVSWAEKALALGTLEPLWRVYDADSPVYWNARDRHGTPWLSLLFANPVYLVGAIVLAILGKRKGWLDWPETGLVAALLFIPYVTRGYEMGMGAFGRFTSVAFPLYLVAGRLLASLPGPLSATLLALSAVMLAFYAALFSAGYVIF